MFRHFFNKQKFPRGKEGDLCQAILAQVMDKAHGQGRFEHVDGDAGGLKGTTFRAVNCLLWMEEVQKSD